MNIHKYIILPLRVLKRAVLSFMTRTDIPLIQTHLRLFKDRAHMYLPTS